MWKQGKVIIRKINDQVTNSSKTMEMEQMLKQAAQAFMQNGGSMSVLMDVIFAPSLMDMRRKIENVGTTSNDSLYSNLYCLKLNTS